MADRFPLILNTSINQIQEIASGDQLDLSGNNIANAGIISATSFSGPIVAGAGTSNITAGIITAVTFKGDGDFFDIDVDGHTNLDNVNISGVSTFAGAIDLNSDIDVDGHTNLDNVSISGFTTITQDLDVDGHTNLDNVSIAGVVTATTFVGAVTGNVTGNATGLSGNPSINITDLDVDGHTNLDNVSIAGVVTSTGNLTIQNDYPTINLTDTNNNDFRIQNRNGVFSIADVANGDVVKFAIDSSNGINSMAGTLAVGALNVVNDLDVDGHTNLDNVSIAGVVTATTFSGNLTGNVTGNINGNLTGTLQTAAQPNITSLGTLSSLNVSGNASIGGVLTYEDVTNIDSVGIVTARTGLKVLAGGANVVGVVTATGGVFVPDNNQIQVGNAAGSADLRIYHQSSNNHSYISETGSGSLIVLADDFYVQDTSTNTMISAKEGAESNLHFNGGTPKLSTTNTGISVTGRADISTGLAVGSSGVQNSSVASFKGGISNQVNIADTSNSGWGLLLTQSQASGGYHTSTNSPAVAKPCAIVNVQNDALNFGTNNTMRWTMDHIGHFYPGGNGHLDIGKSGSQVRTVYATGGVVTGVVTATSFSGDGSNLTGVLVGISTEQVTPSSNVATLNLAKDDHKIVASGTYTIDVSGGSEASTHTLRIENSGTANVGFSTYFKFPSGGTPSLPTASGAISLISFSVHKVGSVGIATVLLAGASVNFS